jgi:hypothetical protein
MPKTTGSSNEPFDVELMELTTKALKAGKQDAESKIVEVARERDDARTLLNRNAPYVVFISQRRTAPSGGNFTQYLVSFQRFEPRSGNYDVQTRWMRYNDFADLHYKLKRRCPPFAREFIPPLPPTRWFNNFDPAFLNLRQSQLELLLKVIVALDPLRDSVDWGSVFPTDSDGVQA